jgi:hypothetical protein
MDTIHFDAPVDIQAAGGSRPTFTMLAYNSGKMRPRGIHGEVVVDLEGVTTRTLPIPTLLNHSNEAIVGHVSSVQVTDKITAAGTGLGCGRGRYGSSGGVKKWLSLAGQHRSEDRKGRIRRRG